MPAENQTTVRNVEYRLTGNTTSFDASIQSAINTLDSLEKKFTKISGEPTKTRKPLERASTIAVAESQIKKLQQTLNTVDIQMLSPSQIALLQAAGAELDKINLKLEKADAKNKASNASLESSTVKLKAVNNSLKILPKTTQSAATGVFTLAQAFTKLKMVFATIEKIIRLFQKAYSVAADYGETMNLFNVATGESKKQLDAFARSMATAYHLDDNNIRKSVAIFRQYANTMGVATKEADLLSENLTKLTYDLASLYNVEDPNEMAKAIRSGLAGQTKSLMMYGISVHKASLEQTALRHNIKATSSQWSEADKVLLRYMTILDATSNAQGDLAKTLESPANQMRIFKEQVQILTRNISSFAVVIGQIVMPILNGFLRSINAVLATMAKASGYKIEDFTGQAAQDMEDAAEATEEYSNALKGLLSPLDEINQASTTNAADGLSVINPEISAALQGYDNLMDSISTKADKFADIFDKVFNPTLFASIGNLLGSIFGLVDTGLTAITNALNTLSPVLNPILDVVSALLNAVSWLLSNVVTPVLNFIAVLTDNVWALVLAFTALNLAQLLVTADYKSMMAVKIISFFANMTKAIITNTAALLANAAQALKTKLASAVLAVAIWWETAAWWQKAIAVIAAAGAMAAVVGAIVLAATSSAKSQADSTMSDTPNIPAMATGGVVSAPTIAMIGEGRYNEAVVPLGNSPQFATMKEDIANEILSKISQTPYMSQQGSANSNRPVVLQLNGREFARAIIPDISAVQPQTGLRIQK